MVACRCQRVCIRKLSGLGTFLEDKINKFTNADTELDALEKEASPNQRDNIPTMRLGLMRASRRFRRLPVSGARWKAFKTPSPPPTPSLPRSKKNPR
jgi:hypothetical protein